MRVDWVDIATVNDAAEGNRRFVAINAKLPDRIQVCPDTMPYLRSFGGGRFGDLGYRSELPPCWTCPHPACPKHRDFKG